MALACLAVPLQLGAGGQNPYPRLAYDTCGPSLSEEATGATFGTWFYKPALNHDADGDSNGTSIVVKRR